MERKGTTDIPLGPEGQEWSAKVPTVLLTRSAQLRPLLGAMLNSGNDIFGETLTINA